MSILNTSKKKINLLGAGVVLAALAAAGNLTYQTNKVADLASTRTTERDRRFDESVVNQKRMIANQEIILGRCNIKPRT